MILTFEIAFWVMALAMSAFTSNFVLGIRDLNEHFGMMPPSEEKVKSYFPLAAKISFGLSAFAFVVTLFEGAVGDAVGIALFFLVLGFRLRQKANSFRFEVRQE